MSHKGLELGGVNVCGDMSFFESSVKDLLMER